VGRLSHSQNALPLLSRCRHRGVETAEKAAQTFDIIPAEAMSTAGITFGQQVWFIGYPFGMSSVFPKSNPVVSTLPFMKRGSMSP